MLSRKESLCLLLCLMLVASAPLTSALAQSRIESPAETRTSVILTKEPLIIPTYKLGSPEPNPIFYSGRHYQGAKGPIYPYPLLDKLTDERVDKAYNAIYLENEHIKISVLPEVGGRIYSGRDKTNNYDFFYRNRVIKPALIGMTGAWISGGVEWNIPHHHRATSFSAVDYTTEENADGSKTIWVGETELRHRMKWLVGLTLRPGKSYIETTVKLFNRTPQINSFLYWANPAVHAGEQYQVIFPPSTEYGTFHSKGTFTEWNISDKVFDRNNYSKGTDISYWKNHTEPISIFAWNSREDFFGGYDHGKQAGVVHIADHHVMPGKKFWEWGNGPEGRIWDKILTEMDGPYIELMAGGYSDNQPDYNWIQPYEAKTFKHYWYPIRKIGSVKNANLDAAVNLEVNAKSGVAKLGFNTTSERRDARVLLQNGDKTIYEQTVTISPAQPFLTEVKLPARSSEENLKASLLASDKRELVAYRPVKRKKSAPPEPVKAPAAPKDIKTVEELYLTGLRLEQFHNAATDALPYYEEALSRDPEDSRVNTVMGFHHLLRGMYKEAEANFRTAIKRVTRGYTSPKDSEALYYLGLALKAQDQKEAAYDAFGRATWSGAWVSAANYALAELDSGKRDYAPALEHLDRSIAANNLNNKALALKAATLRKLGRHDEAQKMALSALANDPLDFRAGNELYLTKSAAGLHDDAAKVAADLKTKMRGEVQSYLETAVDYGNAGLWEEGSDVLARYVASGVDQIQVNPMVHYYLGYFSEKRGTIDQFSDQAAKYYRLAARSSPKYCFPFRLESIAVLRSAMRTNAQDARAPYYLGNLLYDLQPKAAIKEWEKSRDLDATLPTVHRNLAFAYANIEDDVKKAIISLEAAIARDNKDARVLYELDQMYEVAGIPAQRRLDVLERNKETVLQRDIVIARLAGLYVQTGQYEKALALLGGNHFRVWEGEAGVHSLYVDAHLLRGIQHFDKSEYKQALAAYEAALRYPDNIEVGSRVGGQLAQIHYLIGTALEALSNTAQAAQHFQQAVAAKSNPLDMRYYQGLAFLKLNKKEEAATKFDELVEAGKRTLATSPATDFFGNFGQERSQKMRISQAHYLIALGYLGKGDKAQAMAELEKALQLNSNHLGAMTQLSALKTNSQVLVVQ